MSNIMVMTGTPRINGSGVPACESWYTGDTLITPSGDPINVGGVSSAELTIPDTDATPDVSLGENYRTANTILTTITTFINGVAGQRVRVRVTDIFTVIDAALTKTGMIIPCLVGDILEWVYDGVNWIQIGGNVGMGQYVRVEPPVDATASWIGPAQIVYIIVPMAPFVRLGASMVHVSVKVNASAGDSTILARAVGDTDNTLDRCVANYGTTFFGYDDFFVTLDNNADWEARFWTAFTIWTSNKLFLEGYRI